jgi:hypothetical protein
MLRINEQAVTEEKEGSRASARDLSQKSGPHFERGGSLTAFVSEVLVRLYQAYADYARCALQTDLPPTVEE